MDMLRISRFFLDPTIEDLYKILVLVGYSKGDIQKVISAIHFIYIAHLDEKRVSGKDYTSHLIAVAYDLAFLRVDIETIVLALVHDAFEGIEKRAQATCIWKKEWCTYDNFQKIVTDISIIGDIEKITHYKKSRDYDQYISEIDEERPALVKSADSKHNTLTLKYLPEDRQVLTLRKYQSTMIGPEKLFVRSRSFVHRKFHWYIDEVEEIIRTTQVIPTVSGLTKLVS